MINLQLLKELRAYYPEGNEVGDLLHEMIKDVETGAPRQEIMDVAKALREKLPSGSQAYRFIGDYLNG